MPIPTGVPKPNSQGSGSTARGNSGLPLPNTGQSKGLPVPSAPVRREKPTVRTAIPTTPPSAPPSRPAPEPDETFETVTDVDFDDLDDEDYEDDSVSDDYESYDDVVDEEDDYEEEEEEEPTPPPRRTTRARRQPVRIQEELEEDEDDDDDLDDEEDDDFEEEEAAPKSRFGLGKKVKQPKPAKKSKGSTAVKAPKEKKSLFGKSKKPSTKTPEISDEGTFIDEKNLLLKPFGRKKKSTISEFDARKNRQQKAVLVQTGTLVILGLLMAAGLKNAIIPPDVHTDEEIQTIVNLSIGDTGFPTSRAAGFAQDFMRTYLTIDPENAIANRALGYFYTGSLETGSAPQLNRSVSSAFKQELVFGPTLYSSTALTPDSGSFVFGAMTQSSSEDFAAPKDGSAARWSYFTVNVYYDKVTDGFIVTGDSPTVTPATAIAKSTTLPKAEELGEAVTDEALAAITPVINGYIRGYATATPDSHEQVLQYVVPNPGPTLLNGLGGRYSLPENDNSAISFDPYQTVTPGEIKAIVRVNWTDEVSSGVSSTYTSTYVITLNQQNNGMYLVSKFAPYLFVPKQPDVEE